MSESLRFQQYWSSCRRFIHQYAASGPDAQSEEAFNALAVSLFELQFETVPFYRLFCQNRKIHGGAISQWQDIPALPVSAFKEGAITSLSSAERSMVFFSSGTTAEKRSRHFHNGESLQLYEHSLLPWFQKHLLPEGGEIRLSTLMLTPPVKQAPNSSLVHMFEAVCSHFSGDRFLWAGEVKEDGSWALDEERCVQFLSESVEGGFPVLLLGTAFSFVHLIDHLRARTMAFELPAGSRLMETGGYKGRSREMPREELRQALQQCLGIPETHMVSEYGMSESSVQAYDRVVGENSARVFRYPPWGRGRIISSETGKEVADGETGILQVLDLCNIRSVLALQTEDMARKVGDGFDLLGRIPASELKGCSLNMG